MQDRELLFKRTVILTPSRISSRRRHQLASQSVQSLMRGVGSDVPLYVVHDSPAYPSWIPEFVFDLFPASRWDRSAEKIYSGLNVRLIRRAGQGSATALRDAVSAAMADGATYGFIHLDDHVYRDDFRRLLAYGLDALDGHSDLLWVRFSGYPVICNERPMLKVSKDHIVFDTVRLRPWRSSSYTLWWSVLDSEIIRGKYWPVAMWFCVYRLQVLAKLLDWAVEGSLVHLAQVESHFKQLDGFHRLRDAYRIGKFGYINMQYGGIEMHRNANWQELMQLPNDPIR